MSEIKSKIFTGRVMHKRFEKITHAFEYPVYTHLFDLDELESLSKNTPLFSYNRFNLVSLYDCDYLERGAGSIRSKLEAVLQRAQIMEKPVRVELITCGRFLGAVFNPVSFFFCYRVDGSLICRVAQVNNTFDESHLYVLDQKNAVVRNGLDCFEVPKSFHVSPFFDRSGSYEFMFFQGAEHFEIHVNLKKDGEYALVSMLEGKRARPFTTREILRVLLRYPLSLVLTLPRIHWQALKLYFLKKIPAHSKPVPDSSMTIRKARPRLFQRLCMKIVFRIFAKIQKGCLSVTLPCGRTVLFGEKEREPSAVIRVNHYRFFTRLVIDSGIGLGEGYMVRDWESSSPCGVLELLIDNKPYLEAQGSAFAWIGNLIHAVRHRRRANTIFGSRKNIEEHYDLSNDFFKTFLDDSMTYSSGFYRDVSDSLADAQKNKLDMIIEKACIGPEDHVLEIGCGWGSFAIEAVRRTGCRVTGLTLSKEQLQLAEKRVREAGLSDRIQFKLCDYRHETGIYDRIVSIEMLEAVGHQFLGGYFAACDRLLKPDGIAVIQTITIPDQRYESYRRGCDWIQKHIFPGGHLPSLEVLTRTIAHNSHFFIEDVENIGVHYARTLREWRERFLEQEAEIARQGFDEVFRRKWEYYLAYCEAGFAMRYLNDLHLVLTRAGNANLNRKEKTASDRLSRRGNETALNT